MSQVVYWRRELPPLSEQIEGEHQVEATSELVFNDFAHRTELWNRCYPSLVEQAERRIVQEVQRLGGSCAHVVDEAIKAKLDDAPGRLRLSACSGS